MKDQKKIITNNIFATNITIMTTVTKKFELEIIVDENLRVIKLFNKTENGAKAWIRRQMKKKEK